MLAAIFIPAILTHIEVEESFKIDVIDNSGLIYEEFEKRLDTKLSDGSPRFLLRKISTDQENINEIIGDLKQKIISQKIDGFIFIPTAVINSSEFEYYARNVANFDLNRQLRNTVNRIITDYRIRKSGLDPAIINKLTFNISIKPVKIKEGKEEKEGGFIEEYFITLTFVMILYLTILLYGAAIMRGILQEKNSRVVEILLSSVNSFQLMVGKIVGLGSVGLTQYLIWSLLGFGFISYGMVVVGKSAQLYSIDPMIFLFFILFFILGYFLFATIYAGFGAITNTD
jgi:ABC-2 type transport system permease protein